MKQPDTKRPARLRYPWLIGIALFAIVPANDLAAAEPSPAGPNSGVRWDCGAGTPETILAIMARAENSPVQTGSAPRSSRTKRSRRRTATPPQTPVVGKSIAAASRSSVLRTTAASAPLSNPFAVGVSFLGAQSSDSDVNPPDSMGDVGPTQFLVCVNGRIRIFDKTGVLGTLNTTLNNFFVSVTVNVVSDPRVRYDRLTQRWFVTAIDLPLSGQNNRILLAVSDGPTLTGSSSFRFYAFQHNLAAPVGDTGNFADYPTLGVDRHALYVGVNVFDPRSILTGTSGYVINKSNLLTGTLTVTAFRQLASGTSGPGPYSPQGVDNDDPASTEGYFIGIDNASPGLLVLRRVSDPGGTPSLSDNINLTVPLTGNSLAGVPSKGTSSTLDDVDNRLFAARLHKGSLWTAHNIAVDASGVANANGDRDGARWYEITNLNTTPVLQQSGTLFDSTASRAVSYFIPTCAVSGQGHMALGCSISGRDQFAAVAVAGRLAGDELGSLRAPAIVQTSSTPYGFGFTERWGDYSVVTIDPNDDMTFWMVQEYCNANNSWGVRVIQLRAPPPATPAVCLPAAALIGATNVNLIVTGTALNGSGFFDPGLAYSNHISATFNDPAITVNSVSYTDPQHVTLSVSISSRATNGIRTLSLTNPDGQTVNSAAGILNITSQPIIESITESGGSATITWHALAGRSYRVQYKTDLNATAWIDLSGDVTATSGFASKIDPFGSATERYYQVIALP